MACPVCDQNGEVGHSSDSEIAGRKEGIVKQKAVSTTTRHEETGEFIKVTLTDSKSWPHHGSNGMTDAPFPKWEEWRGKTIEIVDYAESPSSSWTCGTKNVWMVAPDSVRAICPNTRYPHNYYVCEHQIQESGALVEVSRGTK